MKIALVQMAVHDGDISANLAFMRATIAAAEARGVDVVLFPEVSLTGFLANAGGGGSPLAFDGPAVARFVALTADARITALTGLVKANPAGRPFISQVAARDGSLLGVYRKRTLPPDEAPYYTAGTGLALVPHPAGPFAMTICADIDNAPLFREIAHAGARLVLHAAAPGLYGDRASRDWRAGFDWWRGECDAKLGRYARENGLFIAVATRAGRAEFEDFPGFGALYAPDGCRAAIEDWHAGVLDIVLPDLARKDDRAAVKDLP